MTWLKKIRSWTVFPFLVITWGLQVALLFAALGMDYVCDWLESWTA